MPFFFFYITLGYENSDDNIKLKHIKIMENEKKSYIMTHLITLESLKIN